jgi:predicted lipoprotein with Yx(FWY)xxD motif
MSKPGFPTRRATGLLTVAAAITLAAACSSSAKSTPASNPSPPANASTTPTTTTVSTGTATVSGTRTTVLTAPDGHTLYYFTPDTAAGQPTCTATCASLWPPLTSAGPTEAAAATGKLTTATGANGTQVVYNGHPLYEYKPDTAAGQATGEGIMGKWYAATPALAPGNASGTPAPTTSGGYGSGGY